MLRRAPYRRTYPKAFTFASGSFAPPAGPDRPQKDENGGAMKVVLRPLIVALAFLACAGCARGGEAVLSRGVTAGGPRPTVPTVTTAAVQGPPPAAPSRPVCELL